ncbi:MAG: XdhC family protein [Candidatus Rokuibacteriota bacterium]
MSEELFDLILELRRRREAFALATVVRCERPTSAKPGARALVREDGSVAGWIGGACAEPTVVREALASLRDGQPRLVSLVGAGGRRGGRTEGLVEYPMTCRSGGTLEIFVEPHLPRPLLLLVGHGPVIDALARLGPAVDLEVVVLAAGATDGIAATATTPRASIVVATHSDDDAEALAGALATPARYVSLVASRTRAASVVERLRRRAVPVGRLDELRAPAGLDIGAVTPQEIAVSILAEIVQVARSHKPDLAAPPRGGEAIDPVCGMTVETATARHRSETPAGTTYFCCQGCKEAFDAAR